MGQNMQPGAELESLEPLRRLRAALTLAEHVNAQRVEEAIDLAHPDISVLSVPGFAPGPGYFGHEEFRRYFVDAARHNAINQAAISRAEVTAGGNVLAGGELISTTPAARQSIPAWFVYRFQDGLISAVETYLDPKAAAKQADAAGH